MEEWVGKVWHRYITGISHNRYADAAVTLEEVRKTIGIVFRALGGDGGLRIDAATAVAHGARRSWLQRLAGSNQRVEYSWRDDEALCLPAIMDVFPTRSLNRDLYIWLAALASDDSGQEQGWVTANQWQTRRILHRFPGLQSRYHRLVQAQIALRPQLTDLADDEARLERAIQAALLNPGEVSEPGPTKQPPQPVYLWLYPPRSNTGASRHLPDEQEDKQGHSRNARDKRRRRAKRVSMPDGKKGLLFYRFETIFSWAEYLNIDRCTDEDEDTEDAENTADDLDEMSVARDRQATASRVRFDLDLPAEANDDLMLGEGILQPEWDYKSASFRADYCSVQPMIAADAQPCELPTALRLTARRLRQQFEMLVPAHTWQRAQQQGSEVDMDAFLLHLALRAKGSADAQQGLYRDFRRGNRDLACLLLADLSLSTDTWVNNDSRVIDVIRDTLFLFAEALAPTGDQFALYGFSSRNRSHVRLHTLKAFDEAYGGFIRGRIAAIKPGFYTRMGAAIRYATAQLVKQGASQRLLLIVTDGKPNDLDCYEGRYGVEDTRMAILQARRQGLRPFCVTIDDRAEDYLPHLFGSEGYVVIRRPQELPRRLPALYAQLTR
jgi:nitric oxide reductase NorD protein